jgi:hypothetical protein
MRLITVCYLHLFIVLYIGVMRLITVCYLHLFIVFYVGVMRLITVCYLHIFIVFYIGIMRLITVCYLHLFIVLYIGSSYEIDHCLLSSPFYCTLYRIELWDWSLFVIFTFFISSPELKAQVSYSDRRLSVVRPSCRLTVCPSVCKLLHFRLLLQNQLANFNQTWHKSSLGRGVLSLCKCRGSPFSKGR